MKKKTVTFFIRAISFILTVIMVVSLSSYIPVMADEPESEPVTEETVEEPVEETNEELQVTEETAVSDAITEETSREESSEAEEITDAESVSEAGEAVHDTEEDISEAEEEVTEETIEENEEEETDEVQVETPEILIGDVYQRNEEFGDDSEKAHDPSMYLSDYTYDASFEAKIAVFPDSYKSALRRIHDMYPNFIFVADKIDMTLDTAVNKQIDKGYKTYQSVFTDDYDTIYKFMDPLTYLYPEYDSRYDVYSDSFNPDWHVDADFFMFADHAYSSNQYGDALFNLVETCDFLENENMDSIIQASASYSMNPYVLASTVILEKGWKAAANGNADVTGRVVNKGHVTEAPIYWAAGDTSAITTYKNTDVFIVSGGDVTTSDGKTWYKIIYDSDGNLFDSAVHGYPAFIEASKVSGVAYYNTYYNLFSINQSDNNAVVGGIAYGMAHGWTSREASFEGGAAFCKDYYYDNKQNTYYYMHYNVLNDPSNWWHEYSTGVSAGLKCARILRYAYDYDHSQYLTLHIPVYKDSISVEKYNGVWTAVDEDGNPMYSYTGFASNNYGDWYVEKGVVTFKTNSVIKGTVNGVTAWWYVKGSKVTYTDTVAKNSHGWWRIVNGKVDFSCNSVEKNEYGWWYIRGGKVNFSYTGVAKNSHGWWRIVKGKVDFSCNSVEKNEYGWWYIRGGKVDFSYTGVAKNSHGWWRIVKGKVDFSFTGLAQNSYGWWYITDGKVDFSYTGFCENKYGWWYVKNGKVRFDFNGIAQGRYGWYYVKNGKIDWDYTGTYTDADGYSYWIEEGWVV